MTDDTPPDPQPLTAEEIARLRGNPALTRLEVRLLATLDAARASRIEQSLFDARPSGDEALRAALTATLRRDDLCDETDGEHHTDDFIAAFLAAFDTEMRGRAALAAPVSQPDETATDYARRYNRRAGVIVEPEAAPVSPSPDVERCYCKAHRVKGHPVDGETPHA